MKKEIRLVHVIHEAFEKEGTPVAMVDVTGIEDDKKALEMAFHLTNNKIGSWSRGAEVRDLNGKLVENPDYSDKVIVTAPLKKVDGVEYGHRSTSVGDKMVLDGREYRVDFVGFSEIR